MNETRKPGNRVVLTRDHLDNLIPGDRVLISSPGREEDFRWMVYEGREKIGDGKNEVYSFVKIPENYNPENYRQTNGGLPYFGVCTRDEFLTLTRKGVRMGSYDDFVVTPGSERYRTIGDLFSAELEH